MKLLFAIAFYLLYLWATTWPDGTELAAALTIAWVLGVPLACVAYVRARACVRYEVAFCSDARQGRG